MAGRVMTKSVYSWQKDEDARGFYWWILSPDGTQLAYVDTLKMAITLIDHLNRK